MAHTYALYSAPAAAAGAAYNALNSSGYFDSVTLDDSTNTITCVKDSETLLTVKYSTNRIDWTFGLYTSYATEVYGGFYVALCDSAVYLGFMGYGSNCYSMAVFKSTHDLLMFVNRNGYAGTLNVTSEDAALAPSGVSPNVSANAEYSTTCPVCSSNGVEEPVSVSKDVYRFVERYTSLPTNSLTFAQIGDATYLTDGFIVMATT